MAMMKQEAAFHPLDCFVSTDGKNRFGVIIAGQVSTQNLNDLRAAFAAVSLILKSGEACLLTIFHRAEEDFFVGFLFICLV